ncbi:MAG: hypothetical protein Q9228_007172 [Teloschistes exilis]
MSQRGFRWAPMSLMGPTGLRSGCDSFPEHAGTLTEDGLRIRLPAFPIRMPTIPFLILKRARAIFNDLGMGPDVPENFLIARTEDGTWLSLILEVENPPAQSTLWEMFQGSTSGYTLLLEEAPPDMDEHEIPTSSLLVHCVSSESEAGQVIPDVLLQVCRPTPAWVTLLEAGYQTSRNLLASDLTAELLTLAIDDEATQEMNPLYHQWASSLRQTVQSMAETVNDSGVFSAIRSFGRTEGTALFKEYAIRMYLGQYIEFGEMMPSDTEWCID